MILDMLDNSILKINKRRKKVPKEVVSHKEIRDKVVPWLAERIQNRMRELNISQTKLQELTGIGASTISDYVTGKCEPTYSKIFVLCDALKVDWKYFSYKDAKTSEVEKK